MEHPSVSGAGLPAHDALHLIVMPTEQCNLRCTYCYEDFSRGRMPPPVIRGLKRFLDRRAPELRRLVLGWFGGEPLLAADIVAEVQRHVQALARRHPGLATSASMTTNAVLLSRRRFEQLLDLGVREYQITLDGPRDIHDRKRVRRGGQGTFDRIWSNLVAASAIDQDFTILARVHVGPDNEAVLPSFIDEFRAAFGGDRRFRLFLRPLSRLGGPQDAALPVFASAAGQETTDKLRQHARGLELPQCEPAAHPVCYAANPDSFVIRSDGYLAKCTVAFRDPGNCVGWLREDGRVELDPRKMAVWMRGLWLGDKQDLACPLQGFAESWSNMDRRPHVWWNSAHPGGTTGDSRPAAVATA